MKQLRALYQRVGYIVSSFVLALSMVTAAVPFILSEGVGAVEASTGSVVGVASYATLFEDGYDVGLTVSNVESDPVKNELAIEFYGAANEYLTGATATDELFNLVSGSGNLDVSRKFFINNPAAMANDGYWILDQSFVWTESTQPSYVKIEFATGNGTYTRTINPITVSETNPSLTYASVLASNPAPKIAHESFTLFDGYVAAEFTASDVKDVNEVKVDLYKDSAFLTTAKLTTSGLADLGTTFTRSSPFNIPGPQIDSSSWDRDNTFVFTADTEPTHAVITVSGSNGTVSKSVNLTVQEAASWNYQNMIPKISKIDAYYRAEAGYTAIATDLVFENVTNATGLEVRVNRQDGSTYSITAKEGVLNSINTNSRHVTSAPVVISGYRTSDSWNNQTGTWVGSSVPVSVDAILTLANGQVLTLRDETISSNKATWSQVKPVDTVAPSVVVGLSDLAINKDEAAAGANPSVTITATDAQSGVASVQYKIMNSLGVTVIGWRDVDNGVPTVVDGVTNLPDGSYVLRARAFDADENKKSGVDVAFVVDRSELAAPVLTLPSHDAYVTGNPEQRWSHPNHSSVYRYLYESYVDEEMTEDVYKTDLKRSRSRVVGKEQNISFWWRVGAMNSVGQVTWSPLQKMTIDNTNPIVSISGVSDGGVYRGPVTVTGLVEDANHSHFYLTVTKDGVNQTISGATGKRTADNFEFSLNDEGVYTIKLEARDLAGNKGPESTVELSFTIDNTAPVVELVGGDITLNVGDVYNEPGVTVEDKNNTTVEITGVVDTSIAGTYTLTYTATDEAGNQSNTVTRTVTVLEPDTQVVDEEDGTSDDEEGNSGDQEALFPAGFASILDTNPDLTPDTEDAEGADQDVAGATTDNAAQVAGASDDASWLGLAWYWWVLIAAAVLGAGWWLAGAIRRRGAEAEA